MDDIIWSTIQTKLESVGEALDGQGQALEVAATARTIPEKGTCASREAAIGCGTCAACIVRSLGAAQHNKTDRALTHAFKLFPVLS